MKIVNKEQFAELPNGTVYCLYDYELYNYNDGLDEVLCVKTGVYYNNGKPELCGVTYVCPNLYNQGIISDSKSDKNYTTETLVNDETLYDYNDDQLFAIFTKNEIRRMINVLTYALINCVGDRGYDNVIR